MATTRTPRATVPGRGRTRRPFRPPLAAAAAALVASVVIVVLLWWSIWFFDGTLATSGALLVIGRVAEVAAAVAGLSVPVAAALGLRAVFRPASFARADNLPDARVAADDVRQWRWYVVGFGTTALIVSFLFWFFGSSGGRVRTVLFNWHYPRAHLGDLAAGFWINVKISVVAELIVLAWALFVAVVRLVPGRAGTPLRWLAIAYTDLFRGIPALLVIYLVVFGFPLAHVPLFSSLGRSSQLFWLAVLGLTLTYGAYVSEVYRAGLESIHWSQTAAARSLGLSHVQTLRYVIVPQAVRRIIPPLLNDFIGLQKDTALVSIVGVLEIVNRATILKGAYFNLSFITGAAVFFLVVTIPLTRFTDYLIKRDQSRTRANG
jgi:polar amino acid transport system permease protein